MLWGSVTQYAHHLEHFVHRMQKYLVASHFSLKYQTCKWLQRIHFYIKIVEVLELLETVNDCFHLKNMLLLNFFVTYDKQDLL